MYRRGGVRKATRGLPFHAGRWLQPGLGDCLPGGQVKARLLCCETRIDVIDGLRAIENPDRLRTKILSRISSDHVKCVVNTFRVDAVGSSSPLRPSTAIRVAETGMTSALAPACRDSPPSAASFRAVAQCGWCGCKRCPVRRGPCASCASITATGSSSTSSSSVRAIARKPCATIWSQA